MAQLSPIGYPRIHSISVAVIEPGTDQRNNANVTGTDKFMRAFGTAIDWSYKSVSQPNAGGREFDLHQGKAWGGTSTINGELPPEDGVLPDRPRGESDTCWHVGMTYIRGNVAEYDAWEALGNPGWNWASLFPCFKKSEQYTIRTDSQLAAGATYEARNHSTSRPLHVGYPAGLQNGSFATPIIEAWTTLSVPHNPDLNGSDVRGFSIGPQTLNPKLDVRWDAALAYYHPVERRRNLKILKQ